MIPWSRPDIYVEPALAFIMTLLVVFWSSGLPPVIGLQLYAEQVLTLVLSFAAAICFLTTRLNGSQRAIAEAGIIDRILAYGAIAFGCYLGWCFPTLSEEVFYRQTEAMTVGIIGLVIVLEALRRKIGYSLLVVLTLVCIYALISDKF